MNEYEILYDFKQRVECEIQKNKLFNLSIEEAQRVLFEKVGVFYKISVLNSDHSQSLIKKYYNTKQAKIDEVSFLQESVKWIMRWCTQYCTKKTPHEQSVKIQAEDIFKLMGIAYAYDRFHLFWDLHNKGVTRYSKDKKSITFNYVNEEVYKQHVCYDSLLRQLNVHEDLNSIDQYSSNLNELMKQVHTLDFKIKFNVEFLGFNLEEYKEFSTSLTELFTEYFLSKSKRDTYILHTKEEIGLIHTEEEWVNKISQKSKLTTQKIIDIINFFTFESIS